MIEKAAKSLVGLFDFLNLLAEYVDNCEKTIDQIKKKLDEATTAKDKQKQKVKLHKKESKNSMLTTKVQWISKHL